MIYIDKDFQALLEEVGAMEFVEPISPNPKAIAKVIDAPKKPKKAKSSINDAELEMMIADIRIAFTEPFQNRDFGTLLEKWGLSARQTPSRLKKLVDAGLLKDLGGSPKSYQVI